SMSVMRVQGPGCDGVKPERRLLYRWAVGRPNGRYVPVLREATDDDVETIRRWRNHPKVRDSSIFTAEITPQMHHDWWTYRSVDPTYHILIFSYRDQPCGVVLFQDHDAEARTSEWGFFLDVDGLTERNELLPAWMEMEKEAVAYGFEELKLT